MDDQLPDEFDPNTNSNGTSEDFGMKIEVEDVVPMDHHTHSDISKYSLQSEPYESNTCVVCLDEFNLHSESENNADIFRQFSKKLRIGGYEIKRLWNYTIGRIPLCDKCFHFAGRIRELEIQLEIIKLELERRLDWVKKAIMASEEQRDPLKPLPDQSFENWRGITVKSMTIRDSRTKNKDGSVPKNQSVSVEAKRGFGIPRKEERISLPMEGARGRGRPRKFPPNETNILLEDVVVVESEDVQFPDSPDRSCSPIEVEPSKSLNPERLNSNADPCDNNDLELEVSPFPDLPLSENTEPRILIHGIIFQRTNDEEDERTDNTQHAPARNSPTKIEGDFRTLFRMNQDAIENQVIPIKRGRGRPRNEVSKVIPIKLGRGRPKNKTKRLKKKKRKPPVEGRGRGRPRKVTVQNDNETPVDEIKEEIQDPDSPDRSCSPTEIEPSTSFGRQESGGNQDSDDDILLSEIRKRRQSEHKGSKFRPINNPKKKVTRKIIEQSDDESDDDEEEEVSDEEWFPDGTRWIKRRGSGIGDSEELNEIMEVKKPRREFKNPWILEDNKLTCCSIEIIDLGSNSFQCTECNVTIEGNCTPQAKYRMIRHMRVVHLVTFKCSVCNFVFGSELDLRRHRENIHDKVRAICEICGKALTRNALNGHLWTHKNSEEQEEQRANGGFVPKKYRDPNKGFHCNICNKNFKSRGHEITHLPRQDRLNRLGKMCSICGRLFYAASNLKNHMINIHPEGGLNKSNWFPCIKCEKRFRTRAEITIHLVSHRTEITCYCEKCGQGFRAEKFLRRHSRIVHEGIRYRSTH